MKRMEKENASLSSSTTKTLREDEGNKGEEDPPSSTDVYEE